MLTVLKIISYIIGHLPMSIVRPLAFSLGLLAYRLDKRHRDVTKENLRDSFKGALSQAEIERISKKVFENLALNLFEFMRIPWLDEKTLDKWVVCEKEDLDRLRTALAKNKGVILFTAHFGNWELLATFYGMSGFDMDVVVRELDNEKAEEFVKWVRTRSGNRIVDKTKAMRRLLKALSQKGIVGILLDQNVSLSEGLFVDFFGKPACTNKGPALLAASSGACVLPTFIIREGKKHRIIIGNEIGLADTGEKEKDALTNTARFTSAIEDVIRKHPEQWFWVHRRWKTRPPA